MPLLKATLVAMQLNQPFDVKKYDNFKKYDPYGRFIVKSPSKKERDEVNYFFLFFLFFYFFFSFKFYKIVHYFFKIFIILFIIFQKNNNIISSFVQKYLIFIFYLNFILFIIYHKIVIIIIYLL